MVTCSSCQTSFDSDNTGGFCPQCGAKAPEGNSANKGPQSIDHSNNGGDSDAAGDDQDNSVSIGENQFQCPSCGEALDESVSFCPSCGEDVSDLPDDEDSASDSDEDGTCSDCGAQLSGGEAFCPECGADIPDDTGSDDDGSDDDGSDDSEETVELIVGNETIEVEDGDVKGAEWRQMLYEAGLEKTDAKRVSRAHLEFERRDDGLFVTDANSANGTEYNGEELAPGDFRKLEDGDEIILAEVTDISVRVN